MRTLCTLSIVLFLSAAGAADEFYVPTDYTTIQEAIDAAQNYDRVSVGEGMYMEQLVVDGKVLEIVGAGFKKTIIQSPACLDVTFTEEKNYRCVVGVINNANVALRNVTIDGRGMGNENSGFVGLGIRNAKGTLQYCKVENVCDTPMSDEAHGVGIYAFNDDGKDRSVEIMNCTVKGYQKCGIAFNGPNTVGLASSCNVLGAGPIEAIAQNGVQIAFNASGVVDGCTINAHCFKGLNQTAVGVLLHHSPFAELKNCPLLANNQTGTYFVNTSGRFTNNITVASVNAQGLKGDFTGLSIDGQGPQGHHLEVKAFGDGQIGTGYFLNRVTVSDSAFDADQSGFGTGLRAWAQEEFGLEISIINCLISDWKWGIEIWDDQFATPHPVLLVDVYKCFIRRNTTCGLVNSSSSLVQAFFNDWDHSSGPHHPVLNPDGQGNLVSNHVAFDPWITGAESLHASTYVMFAATGGTVQFDLDAGAGQADRQYILLGSLSGSLPGVPLPGGQVTLPLNWDLFTTLVLNWINTPVFADFLGGLDSSGLGAAELSLVSMPMNFTGLKMSFAYALHSPCDFVSNPVEILIAP